MARIGLLCPDLLFRSRLEGPLEAAGHDVTAFDGPGDARARAESFDLLLVDLGESGGLALIESMRARDELGAVRTLGFYPHVDHELARRAAAAGFDRAVPRSRMAREPAALVADLVG